MTTQSSTLSVSQLRRRARQLTNAGQMTAAQEVLQALVEQDPGDVATRMELARVELWLGHMRSAVGELLKLVENLPSDLNQLMQLTEWLFYSGEILAARTCIEHLQDRSGLPARALIALARLRWMIGEIPEADRLMQRAMAAGPLQPPDMFLRALLQQYLGRAEEASATIEASLARWPTFADPAVLRSTLRRQKPDANHVDDLRKRIAALPAQGGSPDQQFMRAQFESALFKELDDLGRHEEAWPALERCNALMRKLAPYDAAGEAAVIDAILKASSAIAAPSAGPGPMHEGPIPIFIVGLPRSGTTLLDRMLSSHSQVISAGELNDMQRQMSMAADMPANGLKGMLRVLERMPGADFAYLGEHYLKQTQWRSRGHRFFIDKLPSNIRMVHFIHRAMPQARILHMVRDPMDVCFSNLKVMFGCSPVYSYSYGLEELAGNYRQYRRLVEHWHETLPGVMLDVPYAELVRDPASVLQGVLDYCGLDMEEACLRPEHNKTPVPTPDSGQLREPIHTRGIGQWKAYERQLEPLRKALG